MVKVYDSWANKKTVEVDGKQLEIVDGRDEKSVREEILKLLWHNGSWRFGVGGAHGKDFPPKTELNSEIVNDFTNETDFVKFSDERYVHFLESQVAQLQYKLHLLESGE